MITYFGLNKFLVLLSGTEIVFGNCVENLGGRIFLSKQVFGVVVGD